MLWGSSGLVRTSLPRLEIRGRGEMISHGLISVVGTLTLPPCVTGLCSEQTLQVQDKVTCTVALQTTFCR
jgi:hypothetical protein